MGMLWGTARLNTARKLASDIARDALYRAAGDVCDSCSAHVYNGAIYCARCERAMRDAAPATQRTPRGWSHTS